MEKKVKRVTWDCPDPTGFHQTEMVPWLDPGMKHSTQINIRVKKENRGNQDK